MILHQCSIFLEGERRAVIQSAVTGFKEKWKIELHEKPLTENELAAAEEMNKKRRVSPEWAYWAEDLERSFLS